VSKVRSGQYLRIILEAISEEDAKEVVTNMCNDLRIFNPVTQNLNILNVKRL
jgi:phosphoribosylformylglycinamidine (FGAM) synthase PurS component